MKKGPLSYKRVDLLYAINTQQWLHKNKNDCNAIKLEQCSIRFQP